MQVASVLTLIAYSSESERIHFVLVFFTSTEVCLHGQKASAVLHTSNRMFIHQAMIAISSSNMNFPLNLERNVN